MPLRMIITTANSVSRVSVGLFSPCRMIAVMLATSRVRISVLVAGLRLCSCVGTPGKQVCATPACPGRPAPTRRISAVSRTLLKQVGRTRRACRMDTTYRRMHISRCNER